MTRPTSLKARVWTRCTSRSTRPMNFLGMTGLPTFLCVDVMKRPQPEVDAARYEQHLAEVFGLKA
ncbi:MAG: hypothetical protein ACFWUJ_04325 [Pseudomonas fragi]